jgi:glutamate-1-semialdehyde 2,1-aminomutase
MTANRVGAMFGLFFSDAPQVTNFAQSTACDQARFKAFFHGMLGRGVYLAPSAFEAGFVSSAHTPEDISDTLAAARQTLAEIGG